MSWLGLAIDSGGSKTEVAIVDEIGKTLEKEVFQGCNIKTLGIHTAINQLRELLTVLFEKKDIDPSHIQSIVGGFAGAGRTKEQQAITIELADAFPKAEITITHDAKIALASGAYGSDGIVCIAGTGSIVYGHAGGLDARVGGWGNQLGDEGSGYWLGKQILNAVVRAYDHIIEDTRLTEYVYEHFQIINAQQLISIIYDQQIAIAEVAGLSKYAFIDDWKAIDIRRQGAMELATMISACSQKLSGIRTVVLQGGLFQENEYAALVKQHLPSFEFIEPVIRPIGGAISMLFQNPSFRVIDNIKNDWSILNGFK